MTKEQLLFRLETFKGQLETFEALLSRALKTGKVNKGEAKRELSRLHQNFQPLREYLSHFVGVHHFTTGLHGETVSEARVNTIAQCVTDVSITSAQIARMNDKRFASFMKTIDYSSRKQEDEAREEGRSPDPVEKQGQDDLREIQSRVRIELIQPLTKELARGKRIGISLAVFAIGFGLFGILFSLYFSMVHVGSLGLAVEGIAERNEGNGKLIREMMDSMNKQARRFDAATKAMEQSEERNEERIGSIATSIADLDQNVRGFEESDLSGSIYVALKSGSISAVVEIDPFEKRGMIRGRDHVTGKKLIKGLDPATTNLMLLELSELRYGAD
jgi:hypothetical protein